MIGSDIRRLQKEHPEYVERVGRNYRWNFIALVLDSSIFAFSVAMLSQDTIIPYFIDQLTTKTWVIGLVPAIYYLGYFFPQLVGAYIVNGKSTRKWTMFKIALAERVGILAIALIAQMLGYLSDSAAVVLFLLAYLVFSVTNGMIIPGYADFISKNIIRNRGLFYGFVSGVGGIVGFAASLLARYLLDTYGFPVNIRILFWTGLAVSMASPLFIASLREIPYPVKRGEESLADFIRAIPAHIRTNPKFLKFMITRAMLGLGVMGNSFYALYAIDRFSLKPGALAIFTMIILLSRSLVGFLWGWIGDRFGYHIVYVLISLMVIGMGGLALWAQTPWLFYVIAFCIGSIYGAFYIGDSNMVFEIAPASETSRFIGISNTFVSPVMVLAPLIGGSFVDLFSYPFLFEVILVIGVFSTMLSIFVMPRTRQEPG